MCLCLYGKGNESENISYALLFLPADGATVGQWMMVTVSRIEAGEIFPSSNFVKIIEGPREGIMHELGKKVLFAQISVLCSQGEIQFNVICDTHRKEARPEWKREGHPIQSI